MVLRPWHFTLTLANRRREVWGIEGAGTGGAGFRKLCTNRASPSGRRGGYKIVARNLFEMTRDAGRGRAAISGW